MKTTVLQHFLSLRLSDRRAVPFVSHLFTELERRRVFGSDGFQLEMTWMG